MALVLKITPHQQSYHPGDVLTATLEVACRPARQPGAGTGVQLASVWMEAIGAERVDSSWVAGSYAAEVPPAAKQGRRLVRHLFRAASRPVLQGALLTPGFSQRFTFTLQLPESLPPSFRGTAVRYSYALEAHARYATAAVLHHQRQPSGSCAGSNGPQACQRAAAKHRRPQEGGPWATADAAAGGSRGSAPVVEGEAGSGQRESPFPAIVLERPVQDISLMTPRIPADAIKVSVSVQREATDRRGSSGGAAAADEAQPPTPLAYNVPSADLLAELKPAPADEPAAGGASRPGGAARLMHAASQPAMLGTTGAASPQATDRRNGDGGREPGTARSARRQSAAETPSHPASEPPALRSYNLRMGEAPLVRVAVHHPLEGALQPGAPLAGTLDFRAGREAAAGGAAPRCTEVLVLLETEEAIATPWQPSSRPGAGIIRKVWDEWSELTPDTVLTHFMFSIPLDAPPSFTTPALRLRWLLRFHFTSAPAEKAAGGGGWGLRLGGSAPASEQISWTLPLTVLPPGAGG